ncbi:TPA: hypothetical protein R5B43_000480 [Campylobacter jejuni]|nr:hypothetical protein [Campylobacter jejuni]HED5393459.1 hypothetical protein [Campylobacter jejuni]HED5396543.1 hypothetical protein [Campylobacter jejuni]
MDKSLEDTLENVETQNLEDKIQEDDNALSENTQEDDNVFNESIQEDDNVFNESIQEDDKTLNENLKNEDIKEKHKGEEMAKVKTFSSDTDALIAAPQSLEKLIQKDLFSINAKVDLESNANLVRGTLLISEDFGESFKKCPNEDISAKENIKLALLKDDALKNGTYALLIMGEIVLASAHQSAIKKAFLQNLIIKTKE